MVLSKRKNGEAPATCDSQGLLSNKSGKENIDMNIVAKSDYNFHGVDLVPVATQHGVWFTSSDLAKALEYSNSRAVTMIYNKYSDEFTSGMTQVLEMNTSGNYRKKVRVFSLRGAHLIAMFARTPVAKEFRRWVLDILDREVAQGHTFPAFDFSSALHNAEAINWHLIAIKGMWRDGLEEALRLMEHKHRGSISEHLLDIAFHAVPLEMSLKGFEKNGRIH